ncbi:MAG: type II toxin-antitoxin system death-on-curing family toxin [bacterium]
MSHFIYLALHDVLEIHDRMIKRFGGSSGIRDFNRLESAIFLPKQTIDHVELYPGIIEKAAILCFAIVTNHPFIDGYKRTGHHVMDLFLRINGFKIVSDVDEEECVILNIASGQWKKDDLIQWLTGKVHQF